MHSVLKEQGVHNQGRCILKAWELHESDKARLATRDLSSYILEKLPKRIAVLLVRTNDEDQLPDVEENYVWLPAVGTIWWLDKAKCVEVQRRGFAIVPDFASTVHSATGRTLSASIPDLGAFKDSKKAIYC